MTVYRGPMLLLLSVYIDSSRERFPGTSDIVSRSSTSSFTNHLLTSADTVVSHIRPDRKVSSDYIYTTWPLTSRTPASSIVRSRAKSRDEYLGQVKRLDRTPVSTTWASWTSTSFSNWRCLEVKHCTVAWT